METESFKILPMQKEDSLQVRELLQQLGYAVSTEELMLRFDRIAADSRNCALLVAKTQRGDVVGWIELNIQTHLCSGLSAQICGLVVSDKQRGRGVGSALLESAEVWAQKRSALEIWLRTNIKRKDAHRFYERAGYKNTKTSLKYVKFFSHENK